MRVSLEELESEILKLDPKSRARLAERLLQSLENLSDEENTQLWGKEAQRRDAQMDTDPGFVRSADDVFGEAWSKIK